MHTTSVGYKKPGRFIHFLLTWVLGRISQNFGKVKVTGRENIPATGGAVIAANHRSSFDGPALAIALEPTGRDAMVLAKAELFQNKTRNLLFRKAGVIPVHRNTTKATEALDTAVSALKNGELIALFPEGRIPRDGKMMEFKTGAVRMALAANVPLIPVAIVGTDEVISYTGKHFKRTLWRRAFEQVTMEVRIGKPMQVDPTVSVEESTRQLQDTIVRLLAGELEPKPPLLNNRKRDVAVAAALSVPAVAVGFKIYKLLRK